MRISILTPCFNAADTIERAIKSVHDQDHHDWEHIIVDGGSTDGTIEILRRNSHLIWISEPDQGQSDAMNKAIAMATGEAMTFLNADDEFYSRVFSRVTEALQSSPEANIVIGKLETRSKESSFTQRPKLDPMTLIGEIGDWPQNPVCYFYRKQLQDCVGWFPIHYHYAMDYWWLLRALPHAKAIYSDNVFGCFHNSGNNKTSDRVKSNREKQAIKARFLCSLVGVKYLPMWIKARYWAYQYRRAAP
jgi:glycosyltransferase involved in cell wall biosynthesis